MADAPWLAMQDGIERDVVRGEIFEGKIDAAALGVFGYVAQDVGELEGDAGFLGEFFGAGSV